MGIADDATTLLLRLAQLQRALPDTRDEYVDGPTIDKLVELGPNRLNDAVDLLEQNGYLDVLKTFGTAPYNFNSVRLLSRGRFEAERMESAAERAREEATAASGSGSRIAGIQPVTRFAQPVGSPYGFTVYDWEAVTADHSDASRLVVVFGHQHASSFFDAARLRLAIQTMFQQALDTVSPELRRDVRLDFRPLAAGYGGHLFNRIARDIIGADIAVFETSDFNPNVMIELGVALTWDVRVLPIHHKTAKSPSSDISGQTWAQYEQDGNKWLDPDHDRHLCDMVRFACRRKPRLS